MLVFLKIIFPRRLSTVLVPESARDKYSLVKSMTDMQILDVLESRLKIRNEQREAITKLFPNIKCTVISIWIIRVKIGTETIRKIKQIWREITGV